MVRNQVFRLREIGEGVEHTARVIVRQPPLDIRQHADHQPQLTDALQDESRGIRLEHVAQLSFCRCDDVLGRHAGCRFARLAHDQPEMLQVIVVEFECYAQSHSGAP